MERLLTVSRAAKLIGISRNTLQKKIRDGELQSFEGKVKLSDLSTKFPHIDMEDNAILEKLEEIVDNALKRARGVKLQKLLAPDLGTLAARVYALSKELSNNKTALQAKEKLLQQVLTKIIDLRNLSSSNDINNLCDWLEENINKPIAQDRNHSLLAQDLVLRLVVAQVHLVPTGHEYIVDGNNSILESALSAGFALNYGCNNGECGRCKARLISGEVQATRKPEYILPETERKRGYILTCSNTAVTDVVLQAQEALDESDIPYQELDIAVKELKKVSTDISILTLKTLTNTRLRFLAGQSARIVLSKGIEAVLPIASCPCDDKTMQFHVPLNNNLAFTSYITDKLKTGDTVQIQGPEGNFILNPDSVRPLLFIAFDSGFAPTKSLIEHALTLDHTELAHLFLFTSAQEQTYMNNLCRSWADNIETFRYTSLSFKKADKGNITQQLSTVLTKYKDIHGFDIYIAGNKEEIELTKEFIMSHDVPDSQLITNIVP